MSDIKKIKDEFINKLKEDLDLNSVNQIKTDLFGKNGKISNEFKKLGSVKAEERKKQLFDFIGARRIFCFVSSFRMNS